MAKMADRGAVMVSGWDEDDREASRLCRWLAVAYLGSGKIICTRSVLGLLSPPRFAVSSKRPVTSFEKCIGPNRD